MSRAVFLTAEHEKRHAILLIAHRRSYIVILSPFGWWIVTPPSVPARAGS